MVARLVAQVQFIFLSQLIPDGMPLRSSNWFECSNDWHLYIQEGLAQNRHL